MHIIISRGPPKTMAATHSVAHPTTTATRAVSARWAATRTTGLLVRNRPSHQMSMTSHQMSTTSATQTPPPATSAGHGAGAGAGGAGPASDPASSVHASDPAPDPAPHLAPAFSRGSLILADVRRQYGRLRLEMGQERYERLREGAVLVSGPTAAAASRNARWTRWSDAAALASTLDAAAGSADGDAPRRTPSDELTDAFRRPALLPAFLLLVAAIVLLTRAADDFRMATRRDGRNIVASPPSYYPATSWAGDFVGRRGGEVAGGNRRRGGAGDERDDRGESPALVSFHRMPSSSHRPRSLASLLSPHRDARRRADSGADGAGPRRAAGGPGGARPPARLDPRRYDHDEAGHGWRRRHVR